MLTVKNLKRTLWGSLSAAVLVTMAQAQPSQLPLLTKSSALPSNLMVILDDSGSMNAQYLYQYGGTGGGYGLPGPGNGSGQPKASCPSGTMNIDSSCTYNPTAITLTNTPTTPPTWSNTSSYNNNDFVKGSDNKVYQCQEPTGCDAGVNPTVVVTNPPTWTATNYARNAKVLYSPDGHVYNCTNSTGCGSSRIPGVSSRWDEIGTLAEYLDASIQWSTPGIPLATYLATTGVNTGSGRFWVLSPDVNRVTYDPRINYRVRLTGTGSNTTTPATPDASASFYVFFYGNGGSATPKKSQLWDGTNVNYGDPVTYGSYFAPYTSANQATNPSSVLAVGATTGLSYPQCVGPCTSVPSALARSSGDFPKFAGRTDCTGNVCTIDNERQNYANWKKFHSNRMDLAKTGLGYAFQNASTNMRLGWAQISDLDDNPTNLGPEAAGVSTLSQATKTTFYNWLYARKPRSGTPLRDALIAAGKYFSRTDNLGPWADTPSISSKELSNPSGYATDSTHKTCRRSYTMLLTDGYYNGTDPGKDDVDAKALTASIPGKTSSGADISPEFNYNGTTKPYAAVSSYGTMADIAMKYWIKDLRPDLVNNVVPTATNESYWQNMGFYGIGLGIDGTLPQTPATLAALKAGTLTWPDPPSGGDKPATVDDMWHATVNARGRMMSARNADALSDAVEGMLAEIAKVTDSQAGVAASTASLITGTRKYSPLYTTGSWVGNIVATELDPTNAADFCIKWQVTGPMLVNDPNTNVKVPGACLSGYYQDLIPTHTSRNIYSWNGSTYGNFNSSNTHVQGAVQGGGTASLINYLRGDRTYEDTDLASSFYRQRKTLLGDIVNSTPTLVKGAVNMGYSKLPAGTLGQASYQSFVQNKGNREGILFAGANDGMLHGFRDPTGAEVFAFVPKAVMSNLHLLANRSYKHQFYVDGPTTEVDACLGAASAGNCTAGEWKNLLLGTLGAGGKSVFAIDVTAIDGNLANGGLGASSIKWEITSADPDFLNLGHIFSEVQTGVTTGGQWIAVFGNGFYGADGRAHLYVVNLDTGAILKDIDTSVGGGNGLSAVTLVRNSTQQIIGAYAGDLAGNLWKFDLSSASAANWKLAANDTSAKNGKLFAPISGAKPITAPPAFVTHPLGGRVVVFGTGKFFDVDDVNISATPEGFKGIWDSVEFGTNNPDGDMQTGLTYLVEQTTTGPITGSYLSTSYSTGTAVTSTVTISAFKQSNLSIDWATKKGWYMNIPTAFPGERLVFPMVRLFSETSRLVLANTLAPTTVNPCTSGQVGSGHSYIFDLLNGGRPDKSVIPGCPDCTILPTPPVPPVVICNGLTCYALTPTGDPGTGSNSPPPLQGYCGAQSGIACPSSFKRSWRQLFMR